MDPNRYFPEQVELLLKEAQQEKLQRTEGNDRERPTVTHPYQRKKAVAYSDMWVRRSTDWSDFTGRGGNVADFQSIQNRHGISCSLGILHYKVVDV